MSTLFNVKNAPRNVNDLKSLGIAILYRLALEARMFGDDENAEHAFMARPLEEKAELVHRMLLAIDSNPQAAAVAAMTPPNAPVQGATQSMSQPNYPGAPPGSYAPNAGPPQQQNLPYNPGGGAPTGYGQPAAPAGAWTPPGPPAHSGPPGPPGAAAPAPGAPVWSPPGPPGSAPPGAAAPGGWTAPGGPPGAPPPAPGGYGGPPAPGGGGYGPAPTSAPPAGAWTPPGAPGGPPAGPPMNAPAGAAPGGYAYAPGGPPPGAPAPGGYPPAAGYGQPPVRNPQTPSDPNNQGAVTQLLEAITTLARELQTQNVQLAGITTLLESNFIASVIIAERMGIPRDQLSAIMAGERATIRQQFLSQGK